MIKFFDLSRAVERQTAELTNAFQRVLNSNRYILGNEVLNFEKKFSEWSKSGWTVGCANGTDTIEIGLKSLGVNNENEVITTPLTAMPTLMGIIPATSKIKLVDVDRNTGLISPKLLPQAITEKTKVIIPVHLYGQVCEMDKIQNFSKNNNLFILEDCAQAHGATFNNKPAGSWGILSSWSFYPTKNLGAFGDAGALTGSGEELHSLIKAYRNYGQSSLYHHDFLGRNSRLDELQAALLQVRLELLDEEINNRRRIAALYQNELKNHIQIISGNNDTSITKSSFHIFAIIAPYDREKFQHNLKKSGIETLVHYPIPAHKQKAFLSLGYKPGDFPNAEFISENVLSLPIYPYLKDNEIECIIKSVKDNA